MRLAVIGAGWAGLSAAVEATRVGHHATVFEGSTVLGGRARTVPGALPDGTPVALDNGQHILIGAYSETLRLMGFVGADVLHGLLRLPLTMRFPDGQGVAFPHGPSSLAAIWGICSARGWSAPDKLSLLHAAAGWQMRGFICASDVTVTGLCVSIHPRVMTELIEPLCVSALNTPAHRASGQVFLRVMRDALFGAKGSSNLLLPRQDLTRLFPQPAAAWLMAHGGAVRMATRVQTLGRLPGQNGWVIDGEPFDHVVLATSSSNAIQAVKGYEKYATNRIAIMMRDWIATAQALRFESITTVYGYAKGARLPHPMLLLRSAGADASDARSGNPHPAHPAHPAQFVFDRGQLGGQIGLIAFVVSASKGERDELEAAVLDQARVQLGLSLERVQTVVEKRATFACTPGMRRPSMQIAPGLSACGDYCEGPYPATLEGAVRSALAVVDSLGKP